MPRKHKNARRQIKPKPLCKVKIISFPKRDKHDIRPGRVVMIAEYQERGKSTWTNARNVDPS